MSGPSGRRAPNVSQYIAHLNAIPSAQAVSSLPVEPFANDEEDLAMFTNTQFFDFDMAENVGPAPVNFDATHHERVRRENAASGKQGYKNLDFLNGDFHYQDIGYQNVIGEASSTSYPTVQTQGYPPAGVSSPTSPSSSILSPDLGEKRAIDVILDPNLPESLEDASRVAAEEDKRRRNTAASARFRVKKKQREQALEKTAKEVTDKNSRLEARISHLEMENKWLKNLITEKNESKDDIAEMWRKFNKDGSNARSTSERKDGVGTQAAQAGTST